MTLLKYPEQKNPRTFRGVFKDILESAALEELAIAHLINAQAEKIHAFTGHYGGFPTAPTNKQINEFQGNVARILEALSEKQKLLVRTLELSWEMLKEMDDLNEEDKDEYE